VVFGAAYAGGLGHAIRARPGLAPAKAESVTLGRPALELEDSNAEKVSAIKAGLAAARCWRIARELQAGVGTVLRIKAELVA
jgi:hypothetical protein